MSQALAAENDNEEGEEEHETKFEFDEAFQKKIAALVIRDTVFAQRTKDLIDPKFFTEDAHGAVVRMIHEHVKVHKAVPDMSILPTILRAEIAAKRIRPDMVQGVKEIIGYALKANLSNSSYVTSQVVDFARHQAMEQAILNSVGLLEKGDFAGIEKLQKAALVVGNQVNGQDYDYFKEIESRTQRREDWKAGKIQRNGVSSGVAEIDAHLYHHGWGRKELSLLMGAAKSGKTLGLGEFTKNASLLGFNTFYASCEVSCEIISDRIDAAIADMAMRLLKDDPQVVAKRIRAAEAKAGAFKMRDFASGALKPSQLHRIIEDYRADGIILDMLTVDYADIMAAEYRSDNLIDNMRSIYIDLRALAFEFNLALLTATQTNRAGAAAATAKMTDVAEDFNKIRTADVVISINASEAEKASGEARLYWAASRNTEDGFSLRIRQDREKLRFLTKVLGKE